MAGVQKLLSECAAAAAAPEVAAVLPGALPPLAAKPWKRAGTAAPSDVFILRRRRMAAAPRSDDADACGVTEDVAGELLPVHAND